MKVVGAVVREAGGPFRLESLELGEPQPHEALIRIAASGLCHADILARDQRFGVPLPVVLGHEGAGVVEGVGDGVRSVEVGDRVVMSFSFCRTCEPCRRGRPAYCLDGFRRNFGGARPDGSTALRSGGERVNGHFFGQSSFASHAVVPEDNLVKLADDVDFAWAAPLGCGVQTGAGAIINSLRVPPAASVAVFGAGSVGLSAVMAASAVGAGPIVALDVKPERLRLASELGATEVIDNRDLVVAGEALRGLTGGDGLHFALDTTGRPDVLRAAAEALMITGTLGMIGAAPLGTEVAFDLVHLVHGITVRGILEGDSVPQVFLPQLMDLHRAGRLPVERLVTTFALEDINEAAAAAERGEVVKPVVLTAV